MGKPKTPDYLIEQIKELRRKGFSLPEIRKETNLGYGTVFRYLRETKIDEIYVPLWRQKQGGSIRRMNERISEAVLWSNSFLTTVNSKEKLVFVSALYWAEGSKSGLDFMNSDPKMIKVFMECMRELFNLSINRFRVSIRIFEDLNRDASLAFWSAVTQIPVSQFVGVDVKCGHKNGKLPYGMCRVRVTKGSFILKKLKSSWLQIASLVSSPS